MALLFLSVVVVAFVLFFYGIGLWYLGMIPLVFVGMFFGYYGATQTIKVEWTALLEKYALYIARIIIMAGLLGMMNFFWIEMVYAGLGVFVLNSILWIVSIILSYRDGKILFQIGLYLTIGYLLILAIIAGGMVAFLSVLTLLWLGHMALVAFIAFLVGIHAGVEKYVRYKLTILSIGTIMIFVFNQVHHVYLALAINSTILAVLFYGISKIFSLTPYSDEQKKNISVRRILAGERITSVKKYFRSPRMEHIHYFIQSMPSASKQILEFFNIILIVILIVYYVSNVGDFLHTSHHLLYRVTIVAFVSNVLMLKKIGYNSTIQNLFVFLVINFAIYISLFSYFQGAAGAIATRGIIRNIFSALMLFYAHKVPMLANIFQQRDYIYRIISCVAAMVVNVIVLLYTELPGELVFFVMLMYVGLQSMIIYYASRYVAKMKRE